MHPSPSADTSRSASLRFCIRPPFALQIEWGTFYRTELGRALRPGGKGPMTAATVASRAARESKPGCDYSCVTRGWTTDLGVAIRGSLRFPQFSFRSPSARTRLSMAVQVGHGNKEFAPIPLVHAV